MSNPGIVEFVVAGRLGIVAPQRCRISREKSAAAATDRIDIRGTKTGILDTIMSMLGGGNSQAGSTSTGSPQGGNILGGLLGGAGAGGLGGLISQFQNAGLGHIIQSWIGTGQNQPISPGQLGGVLGDDQVSSMAQHAGMNNNDFLSQLAQHLPGAVDQATPDGRAPNDGGSVAV